MLPKHFRLRKKEDVNRVFKEGKSAASPELALRFLPNDLGQTRVTVLVGKKLHKSAVARNKLRRRIREIVHLNLHALPKGLDLLVVVRAIKLREMDFGDVMKKYLNLLSKISKN